MKAYSLSVTLPSTSFLKLAAVELYVRSGYDEDSETLIIIVVATKVKIKVTPVAISYRDTLHTVYFKMGPLGKRQQLLINKSVKRY